MWEIIIIIVQCQQLIDNMWRRDEGTTIIITIASDQAH